MKKWLMIIVILVVAGVFLISQNREPATKELTVFAASSLTDVMQELTEVFRGEHPGVEFVLNFASSGTLQIQIEQGAPVDIFASAGAKQMQALTSKELIESDTVQNFAANRLVAIAPVASDLVVGESTDLEQEMIRQIGIGDPTSVPVGQYTREALEQLQLWNSLEGRLVYASNVRQVLQYVERGEVELGFVYATDAAMSKEVKVLWTVPASAHRAILYPVGMSRESKDKKLAGEFIRWVGSSAGQAILAKYGFAPAE